MDTSSAKQRLNEALDKLVYVSTLKDRQKQAVDPRAIICGDSSPAGTQPVNAQPWSRADLFRRARTFKSSTWFCKPEAVNAVECARYGWVNTDVDLLQCEVRHEPQLCTHILTSSSAQFCLAKVGFPALTAPSPSELAKARNASAAA